MFGSKKGIGWDMNLWIFCLALFTKYPLRYDCFLLRHDTNSYERKVGKRSSVCRLCIKLTVSG